MNLKPRQPDEALNAGEWKRLQPNSRTIIVACPKCGRMTALDHEVASDGTVTPSLECPFQGCDFHESGVVLEGWPN